MNDSHVIYLIYLIRPNLCIHHIIPEKTQQKYTV